MITPRSRPLVMLGVTPDEVAKFVELIEVREGGCWIWRGKSHLSPARPVPVNAVARYGLCSFRGKPWRVHRLAFVLWVGPLEDGLEVDHLCHIPACVNPDHLQAVAAAVNVQRAVAAGRFLHSGAPGHARTCRCGQCLRLRPLLKRSKIARAQIDRPRPRKPHGETMSYYVADKCRCAPCVEFAREYHRNWRRQRAGAA